MVTLCNEPFCLILRWFSDLFWERWSRLCNFFHSGTFFLLPQMFYFLCFIFQGHYSSKEHLVPWLANSRPQGEDFLSTQSTNRIGLSFLDLSWQALRQIGLNVLVFYSRLFWFSAETKNALIFPSVWYVCSSNYTTYVYVS